MGHGKEKKAAKDQQYWQPSHGEKAQPKRRNENKNVSC